MSHKYGLTYPSYSGVKALKSGRNSQIVLHTCKNSGTDTEEWESEIDKSLQNPPPQWIRKRSYISKLKKQNKKWFFKKNCDKNEYPYSFRKHNKPHGFSSEDGKLEEFNRYCVWNKYDRSNIGSQSLLKTSLSNKSSDDKKKPDICWKTVRRSHIVNKFDKFSKGISKITGKLSSETITLIKDKIVENLEENNEKSVRKNVRYCSKKKTISYIKKILHGTSNITPTYAPRRKKPQKKYNFFSLSNSRSTMKNKSAILPKLLGMKSKEKTMKSDVGTQCKASLPSKIKPTTICRSASEILETSVSNIKVVRSTSETNCKPFHKVYGLSNIEFSKEGSSKLEEKVNLLSKKPVYHKNFFNFKNFSSKNLVNLNTSPDTSEAEITDFCSSSTVISVKQSPFKNNYKSLKKP